tara:strand:- start:4343 stop:5719 length:1377 start_codon:yes stop_codon:yes gene_type:complete
MSDIAVLGAGPAGIMTALKAREQGHEVTIFEASDRVGGMAASFEVAGQRVDFGSHRLHPATDPEIMSLIKSLLGEDLQTRERHGRIRLKNKWIGFPLRTLDMVRHLPIRFSGAVAIETVTKPLRSSNTSDFQSEIQRRLGPTVAREFYGPYARKLYGVDPRELTTELSDRRVSAGGPVQIIKNAVRASRPEGRVFYYPRRGYGQIAESLADAAVDRGVKLKLGAPATLVAIKEGHVEVACGDSSIEAKTLFSSIPLNALMQTLDPPPPAEIVTAASQQRTRGMIIAHLVVPRSQYTEFDAHYFPGLEITTARLSEAKNYRDGDDPDDLTVLCAELACWVDDEIWNLTSEDIGQLVEEDLQRAGLPPTGHVHVEVRRLPSVYPVYEHSTIGARETIDKWLREPGRVVSLGRQGLGVPDNLHHVLAMGSRGASALDASGVINQTAWQNSLDEFAQHVVQD